MGSLGIDLELDDDFMQAFMPSVRPPTQAPTSTDPDLPAAATTSSLPTAAFTSLANAFTPQQQSSAIQIQNQSHGIAAALDSTKPLFFPFSLFSESAKSTINSNSKLRPKDFLEVIRERGWVASAASDSSANRNFNSGTSGNRIKFGDEEEDKNVFWRTESEGEIRKRWEDSKVELTRTWKRRHREAVKSMRRRGGAKDD